MSKTREPRTPEQRASDLASCEMLAKARDEGAETCFDRADGQTARCKFGTDGVCCRICHMGPCRITPKSPRGVCGADADTIAARNYLRQVAAGASAHSDHGRRLVLLLKRVAEGKEENYSVCDEAALERAARAYDVPFDDRPVLDVAGELADRLLGEFTAQTDPLHTTTLAPLKRRGLWERRGLEPMGIDRTIVEALHRTHIGVDHDYRSVLTHAFRTALADGWGGSRVATMVSDILFGTPQPVRSSANLGVLREDTVNVVVHGHEPALSEMLAVAARDEDVLAAAKKAGAQGVTLAGICCTANEVLMRHGIPVAGNFLQQELAVLTGAVELMITDVQCVMASLPEVARAYHTEIVATSEIARTVGAAYEPFEEGDAYGCAKALLLRAVERYAERDADKVHIPDQQKPLVAGFSVEAIKYMLGGTFRASFRPLNDAVIQGRIRGVVGIVGCNNPHTRLDEYINALTRELLARNVLVVKTGCAAIASAKAGMLTPETAFEAAGEGLREVCEAVGMPPVLHMGSCVDNSRVLEAVTEVVAEGGLGDDLSDVPAVGVAPEWMSEKAIAIGCYFVASGIDVVLGHPFHTGGSENVTNFLEQDTRELFGASFHVRQSADEALETIMELLGERRKRLGIDKKAERRLLDMKDRRQLAGT